MSVLKSNWNSYCWHRFEYSSSTASRSSAELRSTRFTIIFPIQYATVSWFHILSTVFILLTVALALRVTVTILSIGNAQTSFALSEGASARGLPMGVLRMCCFSRERFLFRRNNNTSGRVLLRISFEGGKRMDSNGTNEWRLRSRGDVVSTELVPASRL